MKCATRFIIVQLLLEVVFENWFCANEGTNKLTTTTRIQNATPLNFSYTINKMWKWLCTSTTTHGGGAPREQQSYTFRRYHNTARFNVGKIERNPNILASHSSVWRANGVFVYMRVSIMEKDTVYAVLFYFFAICTVQRTVERRIFAVSSLDSVHMPCMHSISM